MRPPQRKLSDLFKFSKPRTPGYEISKDYYLSVLASVPRLPTPRQVMTPKGEAGAVPGMLAPLASNVKADLESPMERGVYALASMDHKSVLKLMVMPRDEAGFEAGPFLASPIGMASSDEIRNRVAATWHVMQLTFEAFDPTIFPALDFLLLTARRLAELTGGIVADPVCQRYLLPEQVIQTPRRSPDFDIREHIAIESGESTHTRGMMKFALPEIEIETSSPRASSFLLDLCDSILRGNVLRSGSMAGPFVVGPLSRHPKWDGLPAYELLPPEGSSVDETLPMTSPDPTRDP